MTKPTSANMAQLMAALQSAAGNAAWTFLKTETALTYDIAYLAIKAWVGDNAANNTGLRVVLTLSDGTVAIDTSKSNNSFVNYQSKSINENHNSRLAIFTALASNAGTGQETKYSTTTRVQTYNYAQRMGLSPEESVGVLRVSISEAT